MSNYSSHSNGDPHIESSYGNSVNTEVGQESGSITDTHGYHYNYGNSTSSYSSGDQVQSTMDARSIYVGQVDYGTSPEELEAVFQQCGAIKRVTILCDKYTGHPKGYGFIEFTEEISASQALSLDQVVFRGRQLKVTPKRSNIHGMVPRGRGRGGRGRGSSGGRYGADRGYVPSPFPPYFNGAGAPMPPLPPGYYGYH